MSHNPANMKRFGLIGCPISHSLSPALFKAAYGEKYGSSYLYDLIEGDDFGKSFATFMESYDGINVTAPFKEKAFSRADSAEEGCRAIGAANLLVKTASGIAAYNTDFMGVRMSLEKALKAQGRYGNSFAGLKAMVAGCGGAGKAAAAAAAAMGMKTAILNRTLSKAEDFASGFPGSPFDVRPLDEFRECFRSSDIIIYTLPGAVPGLEMLSEDDFLSSHKTILEANYRDPCLPDILWKVFPGQIFQKDRNIVPGVSLRHQGKPSGQEAACMVPEYVPGQQWLLYQAVAGYIIFTGEEPDEKAMMKVL